MDYFTAFEISKSGLMAEKLRMDIVALNISNANSTMSSRTNVYKPMMVYTAPKTDTSLLNTFESYLGNQQKLGVDIVSVESMESRVQEVFDPDNPYADMNGYTFRPDINPAAEMIMMINSLRAYQANVKAISAAKSMANEALRIGAR